MEIIKMPEMQQTCIKCGCIFKFDKKDVEYLRSGAIVTCPFCNVLNQVWQSNAPIKSMVVPKPLVEEPRQMVGDRDFKVTYLAPFLTPKEVEMISHLKALYPSYYKLKKFSSNKILLIYEDEAIVSVLDFCKLEFPSLEDGDIIDLYAFEKGE